MKGDLATAAMEAGPVEGATGQGGRSGDKRKGRAGAADRQFTRDELRQLFVLNTATRCETRELLQGVQKALRWTDVPGVVGLGTKADGLGVRRRGCGTGDAGVCPGGVTLDVCLGFSWLRFGISYFCDEMLVPECTSTAFN